MQLPTLLICAVSFINQQVFLYFLTYSRFQCSWIVSRRHFEVHSSNQSQNQNLEMRMLGSLQEQLSQALHGVPLTYKHWVELLQVRQVEGPLLMGSSWSSGRLGACELTSNCCESLSLAISCNPHLNSLNLMKNDFRDGLNLPPLWAHFI